MKILVLSDSHGLQYFMQRCVEALQPDAVIHLGDMVRDADKLADNLWFELKTANLSGEENTYQVQLETTLIAGDSSN